MKKENTEKRIVHRLSVKERDAVCAAVVSRMMMPDWNSLPEEDQKNLINALDKMRQMK